MRPTSPCSAALVHLAVALFAIPITLWSPVTARASDGLLGIFFDREGRNCSGEVPTSSFVNLYVVLLPQGATFGGITGAEFRIDTSGANGFLVASETAEAGAYLLGSALGSGANVAFATCQSGTVALLRMQVLNATNAREGALRVVPAMRPSNPAFVCPAAIQCDAPVFSQVCVEGSGALLNPDTPRPCGPSRLPSQWTRVKELYRR